MYMPNIFSDVKDVVGVKDVDVDVDVDVKDAIDNTELYTDNEDDEDIEQYNIATIKCIREKLIKRTSTLNFLNTLFDDKIRKLSQTKSILELKYEKYKKRYNFWNISTIILSSSLTLIESSKLVFFDDIDKGNYSVFENFFILSPIVLGTIITCSASIIKFKKYQEQMECIYILIDKSIGMLAKLKNKKEEIKLLINISETLKDCQLYKEIKIFNKQVNILNENYKSDIIIEYANVYQETERYINHADYDKYLKIINHSEYKKHILLTDKSVFFKSYTEETHDFNDKSIKDIRNKSMKGDVKVNKYCFC